MTVVATDDFNRANGAIGANWTTHGGYTTPQIVSNAIPSSAGVDYAATYSAANAGADDMYAKVTSVVSTGVTHNDNIVWCRMPNDTTETGYVFDYPSFTLTWSLQRATNGAFTVLASNNGGPTPAGTYTIQVQAVGTTIQGFIGGVSMASVTDSTHSGSTKRYGGIHVYSDSTGFCLIDNFEMGNFAAAGGAALPDAVRRRHRRHLAGRRPRFVSVVPPAQVIVNPGFAPLPARRTPRTLPPKRARSTQVVPVQVVPTNPLFVSSSPARARRLVPVRRGRRARDVATQLRPPPPQTRAKARILPRVARRGQQHVAGQLRPPPPQPSAGRTRLSLRRRRGAGTQVPPTQVILVAPNWVPSSQAFSRRIRTIRRNVSSSPVPAQVTFVLSPYVQRPPRTAMRTLPFKRARSTFVVPLQIAPVPPAYVPQGARRGGRLLPVRRGRRARDVATQLRPPPPQTRAKARILPRVARRGQQHVAGQLRPPPPQPSAGRARRAPVVRRGRGVNPLPVPISIVAPALMSLIPARVRRILAKARRRLFAPPYPNTVSPFVPPVITGPRTTARGPVRSTGRDTVRTTQRSPRRTTKGTS